MDQRCDQRRRKVDRIMILCHPQMENVMDFTETRIQSLVIESPTFFRTFLQDLYEQIKGEEGLLLLSEQDRPIEIGNWVEIIDNFLNFDLNKKSLLNKIIGEMERISAGDTFFLKTADILQQIEKYTMDLAFSFDCDIVCGRCSVSGLLKGIGVSVRDEYEDPLERLIDYMELVREFERDKLFVYVNLRSFFSDEEVDSFLRTALDHGYRILLVEAQSHKKLPLESRITVDKDLCEF